MVRSGWTLRLLVSDKFSFQINSARFLFVFGAPHLLSVFWSLFVGGLPSDQGRFNEALIESEKTKLAADLRRSFFSRLLMLPQTSVCLFHCVEPRYF